MHPRKYYVSAKFRENRLVGTRETSISSETLGGAAAPEGGNPRGRDPNWRYI
jgi:hypothetical protein